MEFIVPDTLVLKIVEQDVDLNRPDTTMYILYDKVTHRFVIRGKRTEFREKSCTYSYECELANDLADFLERKFNRKVDLISKNGLKQNFYEEIKNEIQYV